MKILYFLQGDCNLGQLFPYPNPNLGKDRNRMETGGSAVTYADHSRVAIRLQSQKLLSQKLRGPHKVPR